MRLVLPLVYVLVTSVFPYACAASEPLSSNSMIFHGVVRDIRGQPVDGVSVEIGNYSAGMWNSCMANTAAPGVHGRYCLSHLALLGSRGVQVNDVIQVRIVDPWNRLRRQPRVFPVGFNLLPGDVGASSKRLDLTMY
jgi:hypothetical protein